MEIVALQEYTDNKISLYEGEIRNIGNNLAQKLIEEGVVAEHSDSGQTENEGFEIVNITVTGNIKSISSSAMDKEYEDIYTSYEAGRIIFANIIIGNGGGPDARMIPLAYDNVSKFVGASIMYEHSRSKMYELKIEISSNACSLQSREILQSQS